MSDLIERQTVIEALEKRAGISWDALKTLNPIVNVVDDLPSTEPEQKWIPCSEELPKVGEYVLAQISCGAIDIMKLEFGYDSEDEPFLFWETQDLDWETTEILAWMPLPEPYVSEGR